LRLGDGLLLLSSAAAFASRSGSLSAALVATQTFGGDEKIVVDARIPGVAAAAVAIWRGAPVVAAMFIAALVTALVRVAA
jgi:hypothetical protein